MVKMVNSMVHFFWITILTLPGKMKIQNVLFYQKEWKRKKSSTWDEVHAILLFKTCKKSYFRIYEFKASSCLRITKEATFCYSSAHSIKSTLVWDDAYLCSIKTGWITHCRAGESWWRKNMEMKDQCFKWIRFKCSLESSTHYQMVKSGSDL